MVSVFWYRVLVPEEKNSKQNALGKIEFEIRETRLHATKFNLLG